jgi:HAD superfamily hydrolase (TIGR01509 family)
LSPLRAFWYRLLHCFNIEQPSQSREIILFHLSFSWLHIAHDAYRDNLHKIYRNYSFFWKPNTENATKPLNHKKHSNQPSMSNTKLKAKAIFLDLDGTIVDSTDAYIEAANIAFQALNLPLPAPAVALEIPRRLEKGIPIHDITHGQTHRLLPLYFKAYYTVSESKTSHIPNVTRTLEALSQNAKLAVITMRHVPKPLVQKELDYFGIAHYFSHVMTAMDTCKPKPHPDALIRCVEALNVAVCDCLMVGDSVSDVRAGKAAGIKTVSLLSGLYGREELALECPDLILPNVNALLEYIE